MLVLHCVGGLCLIRQNDEQHIARSAKGIKNLDAKLRDTGCQWDLDQSTKRSIRQQEAF